MLILEKYRQEEDAAERIGKSQRTLQLWRQRGEGPRWTYIGKTPVTTDEWIEEYLRSRERQPVRRRQRTAT
jgi:hypothetical protein